MSEPQYRKAPEQSSQPPKPATSGPPGWLKIIGCLLFLISSCMLWLSLDSARGKLLYYLLFSLPNWFCAEWLSGKVFHDEVGSMISNSEFSFARIIFGVVMVIVLFGATWGMAALGKWLLLLLLQ